MLRREHYRKAEELLKSANSDRLRAPQLIEMAKVHATLAGVPMDVALDAGNPE